MIGGEVYHTAQLRLLEAVDELDQLLAPIAVLAGERDEFARERRDRAAVRRSRHRDAATAPELEQSLVAQRAERSQHRVRVYADHAGQVLRGRQPLAGSRLATAGLALQRLIFDPATGALLAGPKGSIVAQGIVDSLYDLPKWTAPVRVAGGPAVPALLTISARIGGRATSFRLTVHPAGRQRAPALDWALAGTPGEQCFPRGFPRPLRTSVIARRAYVYELAPAQLARQTWCPGPYELQVVTDYAPRPAHTWRPGMPGPTFSSGIGTSIYFEVK
jgi:hypothetical protein